MITPCWALSHVYMSTAYAMLSSVQNPGFEWGSGRLCSYNHFCADLNAYRGHLPHLSSQKTMDHYVFCEFSGSSFNLPKLLVARKASMSGF